MNTPLQTPVTVSLQPIFAVAAPAGQVQPLLSIVVCAYRHETYVEECLASIDRTGSADIELLVIDDGSPDDTLQRCISFRYSGRYAVQVYTKPNQGLVHSLHGGLALARGRFVAFIASDDFYTADGLQAVCKRLQQSPLPDALLCQAALAGQRDGELVYGPGMQSLFALGPEERLASVCLEMPKPMLLQATAFRTEFLRRLQPWSDGLELDDWPTFIRVFSIASREAANVCYAPDLVLCRYRMHSGGIHNRLDRQLRVTEQVARTLVPTQYRRTCLANVRIDIGLIHLYRGRWLQGSLLCLRGLLTAPRWRVIERVLLRLVRFMGRRTQRKAQLATDRQ